MTMKKTAASLIFSFCALGAAFAAAPASTPTASLVPANAIWFAQLNADQLRQTQLWQAMLKEMDRPAVQNRLEAVKSFLNFDPRKDVAVISAGGKSFKPGDIAVLGRGGIDTDLLQTMASNAKEHDTVLYQDRVIHSWPDRKRTAPDGTPARAYGSVPTNGTVVLSQNQEAVEAVLDVLDGRAKSLAASPQFAGLGAAPEGAFLILGLRQFEIPKLPAPAVNIIKHVSALRITLAEQEGQLVLEAQLLAQDEASARNLQDILLGLKAGVAMQERPDVAIKLAQATTVKQTGARVSVTVKLGTEEAIGLVRTAIAARRGGNGGQR
jgi:hypothetical protein